MNPKPSETDKGDKGDKGSNKPKPPRSLVRRKSDLPLADFETAMALKHYNTVDKVLQPSKES